MFKHQDIVEEVKASTPTSSFDVVNVANPADMLQAHDNAPGWATGCPMCSGYTNGWTEERECIGCSMTFSDPKYTADEESPAKDLPPVEQLARAVRS